MLILEQFTSKTEKRLDFSPFCAKVEAFLRLHKIPYEVRASDVRKTPKHKLPVLRDGDLRIGDSDLIIKHLSEKHNIDMDAHLNDRERAIALGMRKFIEEWVYWGAIYFRWKDDQYWPQTRKYLFGRAPWFVRTLLAPFVIRPNMIKSTYGQGMGRHSSAEVTEFMHDAVIAIRDFLGERPYFMGEQISTLDMTAFPFIWVTLYTPLQSPLVDMIKSSDNLRAYADRLFEEIWLSTQN